MELTDQFGWSRIHGAVIGANEHMDMLLHTLEEHGVLAEVQRFDTQASQISLVAAHRNGRLGVLEWEDTPETTQATITVFPELREGPLLDEFAEELATALEAEVRIGTAVADHLGQPAQDPHNNALANDMSESAFSLSDPYLVHEDVFPAATRMIEISGTAASALPLFAAIHGAPLGCIELVGAQRALFVQAESKGKGRGFGDLPTVTLASHERGVTALLVTDDHVEHISSFDWSMKRILVTGKRTGIKATDLPVHLADLVTKRLDLLRIAQAVEGANPQMFTFAALSAQHEQDWQVAAAALGLPQVAVDFLSGAVSLDDAQGIEIHPPISVSSAIGRSVDLALDEVSIAHPLWDTYESFVQQRPWVVNVAIAGEAIVGAGLLGYFAVSSAPRSSWRKISGLVGAILVVDSIAEFGVKTFLKRRAKK